MWFRNIRPSPVGRVIHEGRSAATRNARRSSEGVCHGRGSFFCKRWDLMIIDIGTKLRHEPIPFVLREIRVNVLERHIDVMRFFMAVLAKNPKEVRRVVPRIPTRLVVNMMNVKRCVAISTVFTFEVGERQRF